MPLLGKRFDDALVYASDVHREQLRKGTSVPYVSHLLGVCSIVLENGGDEVAAIGALLHDAAEDHGGEEQLRAIEARFGPEVAHIVRACSDALPAPGVPKEPWLERKLQYCEHLASESDERVLLVSAADKVYNLRSIVAALRSANDGEAGVYGRFKGRKWGTLWNYRGLADAFAAKRSENIGPLVDELNAMLERLAPGLSREDLLQKHAAEEPEPDVRTAAG